MMLTSSAGVLLASHSLLIMGDILFGNDAVTFAKQNATALNATVIILAFFGVIIQHLLAKYDHERTKALHAETKLVRKKKLEIEEDEEVELAPWYRRMAGKAA